MCKEEDYAFLNVPGEPSVTAETSTPEGDDGLKQQDDRQERVHQRLEMEQREQEKRKELEEQRRDFQRRVLTQDLGLDPSTDNEKLNQLLMKL
ncbi:hypothetical protein P4O66_014389 [Electrophorus voltai]|uniref:Uncharacterized protein n=1 Tax=Electrophorus voltai TaxID=2609070 RepID=A0AAD9DRY6_9TELE|nr:hypothetical protein P4O66_014389 [Electrophorus voltai]